MRNVGTVRLFFTDYKIQSRNIFTGITFIFSLIVFALFVVEWVLDVKTITLQIIAPFSFISFCIALLSLKFYSHNWLKFIAVAQIYLAVEIHFLENPRIFHTIIYWLPFIPFVALIIQGIRSSLAWISVVLVSLIFNFWYLNYIVGPEYQFTIKAFEFFVVSIIFLSASVSTFLLLYILLGEAYAQMKLKNEELENLKNQIEAKQNKLVKYQLDLVKISKEELPANMSQAQFFHVICKAAVQSLDISCVSIWFFENGNENLERKAKFQKEDWAEKPQTTTIYKVDYPIYFDNVLNQPFIMADDAQQNEITKELFTNYLLPNEICSILDCCIKLDGVTIGVICCENIKAIRNWTTEDTLFIQTLADFVALSLKNEKIKNLLIEIRRKNRELVEKNHEIAAKNNETNALNEELISLNDLLETKVMKRTEELEMQNKVLTEYAFINSHLLRAPLSRILGLSMLFTSQVTSVEEAKLLEALIQSTNELDAIVRKISDILYEGNNMSRHDIQEIINRNFKIHDLK